MAVGVRGGNVVAVIERTAEVSPAATIVLADDHRLVRSAVRKLLEAEVGLQVVEEAGDLGETLRKVRAYKPTVLVLDLGMPGGSSLTAIPRARIAGEPDTPVAPPDHLSDRELQVSRLITLGHSNAEIAHQLFLSVRTVESHRSHIQHKVGHTSRAELVAYAHEHDLI